MTFTLFGGRLKMDGRAPAEDGLWLAASVKNLPPGARVLDAGAGSGVAGLALLYRMPQVRVTAVEIEPELVQQAQANAALNGFGNYSAVVSDILNYRAAAFDAVICNPPFHAASRGHHSDDSRKQLAHHQPDTLLADWLTHMKTLAAGPIYLILHHDNLGELKPLAARLGLATQVRPLATHATRPAKRALVCLTRGSGWSMGEPVAAHDRQTRKAVLEHGHGI